MSERAIWLYDQLLRLYPTRFRRAHGDDMRQAFQELDRDNRAARLRFWSRVLRDFATSLCREHVDAMKRPMAPYPAMTERQFIWGLSNGVIVLAFAGMYWLSCGVALGPRQSSSFLAAALLTVLAGAFFVMFQALHLRQKARGFRRSTLCDADRAQQLVNRQIIRSYWAVVVTMSSFCALAGFLGARFHHPELIWPSIGVMVSLHFLPLGRIFHVRAYYATGIVGTAISLITIFGVGAPMRPLILGCGMGIAFWLSALYLVRNADRIVREGLPT